MTRSSCSGTFAAGTWGGWIWDFVSDEKVKLLWKIALSDALPGGTGRSGGGGDRPLAGSQPRRRNLYLNAREPDGDFLLQSLGTDSQAGGVTRRIL